MVTSRSSSLLSSALVVAGVVVAAVASAQTPPAAPPAGAAPAEPARATLQVTFIEIRSDRGRIAAGLYATREGWPERGTPIERCRVVPRDRHASCRFSAAPGVYAVSLMHDEDGDGVFDRNFLGLPEEGFGFSNNPGTGLTGPSWESSTFTLAPAGSSIAIRVRYGI